MNTCAQPHPTSEQKIREFRTAPDGLGPGYFQQRWPTNKPLHANQHQLAEETGPSPETSLQAN